MKEFESLISTWVEVIKATPVLMDSKTLTAYATNVIIQLKSFWVLFTWVSHLNESVSVPTLATKDKEPQIKAEQYSFSLWKWFVNINSSGSVYYKNNGKTITFGRLNKDSGMVEFYPVADWIVQDIKSWQSTWLQQTTSKEEA